MYTAVASQKSEEPLATWHYRDLIEPYQQIRNTIKKMPDTNVKKWKLSFLQPEICRQKHEIPISCCELALTSLSGSSHPPIVCATQKKKRRNNKLIKSKEAAEEEGDREV